MADTLQVVSWSLERKCPMRRGDEWFLPGQTSFQLAPLRTVASAEGDRRNVGGICVTGWTTESDNSGNIHDIPSSGFRIDDRLGPYGGMSKALSLCQSCEANAESELKLQVAGCFGHLRVWPDSKELDEQLWKIIEERNLESRLRAAFTVTTPLWYGFWIKSPLLRLQAELLSELLDAVCDHEDSEDEDIRHFLEALTAAIKWELPLHVSLSPLGHTDFGFYTVFPHCPRCKANAPVGRWKESYPTENHECPVCRHHFNPDKHHSSEQDNWDWQADSLEFQLGEVGYEQFIRDFLNHRGCSPAQVEEVIDNKNNGPLLRRIQDVRRRRNASIRRLIRHTSSKQGEERSPHLSLALEDDINLELVLIPEGEFLMGSADTEENNTESPQHLVRIVRPFYMGRFPVTQAQWIAVMGKNPSRHVGNPLLPVDQVSWFDCQEFCERLSQRKKRIIRLPSEAEWEYACRAGTTTKYAFGDSLSSTQANFTPFSQLYGMPVESGEGSSLDFEDIADIQSAPRQERRPTPVGSYSPNAWGLYDMHGNVDEWCEDVWHPTYVGAPSDGIAWLDGEDKEAFRVVRGGWCSATEFVCTSSSRRQLRVDAGSRDDEGEDENDDGFLSSLFDMMYIPYGFRVVCEFPTSNS